MTEFRRGIVRGLHLSPEPPCPLLAIEVEALDTSSTIMIRGGFSFERGRNFAEKRAAFYGREIFFDYNCDRPNCHYTFEGFVRGDDL